MLPKLVVVEPHAAARAGRPLQLLPHLLHGLRLLENQQAALRETLLTELTRTSAVQAPRAEPLMIKSLLSLTDAEHCDWLWPDGWCDDLF